MTSSELNRDGDLLIPTTGAHGADIASQRIDDLDRRAMRHLLDLDSASRPTCVDLGCGLGWQGLRLAMLGADSHLFDQIPEPYLVETIRRTGSVHLIYKCADLSDLPVEDLPTNISIAFSQRFVHYLHYSAAQTLIERVATRMAPDGMFFLSASGIDSELGNKYQGKEIALSSRFAPLDVVMQEKHGIFAPVCLYSTADLVQLMTLCNFETMSIWRSTFGNIKGVFRRKN